MRRPAGRELFLLTLLTFDRSLAQLRLGLSDSELRGFAVTDDVKDLLLSDEAGSAISPNDFGSDFMQNLAQAAIEESYFGRIDTCGTRCVDRELIGALDRSLHEEEDRDLRRVPMLCTRS